jgi:phage FluMu protein Com
MSVIGYIIRCDLCNAKLLVTADAKDSKFCPDCLDQYIQEAIADAIEDDQ